MADTVDMVDMETMEAMASKREAEATADAELVLGIVESLVINTNSFC